MIPRGIRNNNPGNIRGSAALWQGQVGLDDKGFVIFDTAENGLRALGRLLTIYQDRYGLNTVRGIINRWAPSSENDTAAYVAAVCAAIGKGPDAPLDTHDPATLGGLMVAIVHHENGIQPYTPAQVMAGAEAATGHTLDHPATPAPPRAAAPPVAPVSPPPVQPETTFTGHEQPDIVNTTVRSIPVVGPLLIPLLTALQAVPDILKIFAGKNPSEVAQRNTALAEKVADVAIQAIGATGPGDAIDKLQAEPAKAIPAIADAVRDDKTLSLMLVEAGGGGIGGARAFVSGIVPNNPAMARILEVVTYWVLGFLTFANLAGFAMAGLLAYFAKTGQANSGEWQQIVSTLIQADINAAFAAVGFWLGSSLAKGSGQSQTPVHE